MGSNQAKAQLGIMLLYGHGVERNVEHAIKWLRDAADKDKPTALREMARLHESGTGLRQDLEEATRLMAKAAGLGDQAANDWLSKNCPEKPAWLQQLMLDGPDTGLQDGGVTETPKSLGPESK